MKSFAQLQRDMHLGVKVKTITNNCKPENNGEVREISKVQTNAIAFRRADGKDSWMWWDKKHNTFEYDNNILKVFWKHDNSLAFVYEILG